MLKLYRPDITEYNGLDDLIATIPKEQQGVCVEVGSAAGRSTERFARAFEKVICIDPWEGNWAKYFEVFKKQVRPYPHVYWFREASPEGLKYIEDASVNLGYIDAIHTAPHPYKDIEALLPKIVPGGYIGGHDYREKKFPDVVAAVHKHFPCHFVHQFKDNSWLVRLHNE